jgi:hypothetical protein
MSPTAGGLALHGGCWWKEADMAKRSSAKHWRIGALLGIGVTIGVWLAVDLARQAPDAESRAEVAPADDPSPPAQEPEALPAPDLRIAEGGRLSIDAASLRDAEVLALGLALTDEARGDGPLPARVVSVDGRRLEIIAAPVAGRDSGLRLEIEANWLKPGRYMIEISTAENTPLPLRRYVLEVQ